MFFYYTITSRAQLIVTEIEQRDLLVNGYV